jgi:tellurite resistance protein
MSIANLVPAGISPSAEHVDVLLELAFLTTAADGRLDDDELTAFKEIASRLRGKPLNNTDVDALLDKFGGNVDHEEISARVQKIAPTLPTDLRELAFKLAVALSVADLDASGDESDLQVLLAETLGFDEARVDTLTGEVYAGLDAGED